jgi:hypothetical protein
MIPKVAELAQRLETLSDQEITAILAFHVLHRPAAQEICDIEADGERLRFDVDALNAHLDAHPNLFPIGAFPLDDDTVGHVFSERFVEFERAASIRYAPNAQEILLSPTTMVEHGGENMLIDGANRVAVLASMDLPAARARVAPEAVWRRFLLPIEGPGVRPFATR